MHEACRGGTERPLTYYTGGMRTQKLQPPPSREQELLEEFQQAEAAELRDEPEAVDKRIKNRRKTWGEIADDAKRPQ